MLDPASVSEAAASHCHQLLGAFVGGRVEQLTDPAWCWQQDRRASMAWLHLDAWYPLAARHCCKAHACLWHGSAFPGIAACCRCCKSRQSEVCREW